MRDRFDIQDLMQRASESLHASRCFGAPYEKDGVMVIPVAAVIGGGGGGAGTQPQPEQATPGSPPPQGSGGGFGTVNWPLGVYTVKDGEVRWVPAVDMTRVALSGVALVRGLLKLRRARSTRRVIGPGAD